MSELPKIKPDPGAILHLGNGSTVYVIEEYERACELWTDGDRLVEYTTYSDLPHTDERVTYRLTIPVALIMRIDEFSDAITEAIERDKEKHRQDCLKAQEAKAAPGEIQSSGGFVTMLPVGAGFGLEIGPEGIRLTEEEEPPPAEEEGSEDDGQD